MVGLPAPHLIRKEEKMKDITLHKLEREVKQKLINNGLKDKVTVDQAIELFADIASIYGLELQTRMEALDRA